MPRSPGGKNPRGSRKPLRHPGPEVGTEATTSGKRRSGEQIRAGTVIRFGRLRHRRGDGGSRVRLGARVSFIGGQVVKSPARVVCQFAVQGGRCWQQRRGAPGREVDERNGRF